MTKQKPWYCTACKAQLDQLRTPECPEDCDALDTTTEEEWMEGGFLKWYGYCKHSNQQILMQREESTIDAANTVHYLNEWAQAEQLPVSFERVEVETGNGRNYRDRIAMLEPGQSAMEDDAVILRHVVYSFAVREVLAKLKKEQG